MIPKINELFLTLLVALTLTACASGHVGNFGDVKMGMTKDQVYDVMGHPDRSGNTKASGENSGYYDRWELYEGEFYRVFYGLDGRVTSKRKIK